MSPAVAAAATSNPRRLFSVFMSFSLLSLGGVMGETLNI
jgi:hypothetical protein